MKKIIMFVMVLAISAPSLADDLNPPDWALGPGTIYGIWDFPVEWPGGGGYEAFPYGDYPEEGAMVPHDTNLDPAEFTETIDTEDAAHKYMMVPYCEYAPTWVAEYEGREGVLVGDMGFSLHSNNFPGSGTIVIQLQMTWTGTSEIDEFWSETLAAVIEPPEERIDIGDGWTHSTWDFIYPNGTNPDEEGIYFQVFGDFAVDQIVMDVISYPGAAPPDGPGRELVPTPFIIDPNVMTVYETDETEGDFDVSMRNPMEPETSVTVTVDPNSDDITLIGSAPDGTITMIFDANNWDVPQTVAFKAIDDEIPEPPNLKEPVRIKLSSIYSEALQDPNWAGEKTATVNVVDNDQANILFRATPYNGGTRFNVTGPVPLREQLGGAQGTLLRWRKIGIQLQVQPSGGPVKLQAEVTGEIEGDNLPPTDPCLPLEEADDPNCFTYTSTTSSNGLGTGCPDHDVANKTTCWNVDQDVKIWGNDDDVLQAEGAEQEGDENYQAVLRVWVIDDGGDERYTTLTENAASLPGAGADAGPKTVQFNIEDNECGAWGISYLDIGNPNAATDPNYQDEDGNPLPDCYVDIYDVIEFATQWLDCSDISDPSCESQL